MVGLSPMAMREAQQYAWHSVEPNSDYSLYKAMTEPNSGMTLDSTKVPGVLFASLRAGRRAPAPRPCLPVSQRRDMPSPPRSHLNPIRTQHLPFFCRQRKAPVLPIL
jgi:hypothetical protein